MRCSGWDNCGMGPISVTREQDTETSWVFGVSMEESGDRSRYTVTLEKSYWEYLTSRTINPEVLVQRSFQFLLAREPKEAILSEFNLSTIGDYFPEFEDVIQQT